MKREFLEGLGIDKETVEKVMAAHGKATEALKTGAESAGAERDALKQQLATVQEALKKFDGKDPDKAMQERDAALKAVEDLKTAHTAEIASRDFDSALTEGIAAAKGKNARAIKALLDVDTLKASKNQKEDMAAAIRAIAESDAYLFESTAGQNPTPAKVTTGGEHTGSGAGGGDSFTAAAMKGAGLDTSKGD